MKNLFFLCFLFFLSGCYRNAVVIPPCEESGFGTVCFDNNTDVTVDLRIDDNRADILPFSSVCFEMREDWYNYRGKRGLRRWRGEVFVERCRVTGVGLFD